MSLIRNEQALAIAEAFVSRKVDIIVAGGNAVAAAKQATSSIADPVGRRPLRGARRERIQSGVCISAPRRYREMVNSGRLANG
jgi:hypothetical protein